MRKTQKKLLLCGILACMSALGNVAGISAADIRILGKTVGRCKNRN